MGNSISFQSNLTNLSQYYLDLIHFVDQNTNLKKNTKTLRQAIKDYTDLAAVGNLNILNGQLSAPAWIWTVHKFHPIVYKENNMPPINWFIEKCIRQAEFNGKILAILDTYNFKIWKKEYKKYLKLCKDSPNLYEIPTLEQAFMWHAHMIDNENYIKDSEKYISRILDNTEVENVLTNDVVIKKRRKMFLKKMIVVAVIVLM